MDGELEGKGEVAYQGWSLTSKRWRRGPKRGIVVIPKGVELWWLFCYRKLLYCRRHAGLAGAETSLNKGRMKPIGSESRVPLLYMELL